MKSYRESGNEIAENLKSCTEFPVETEAKARRKFDSAESVDEPLMEENKFKINVFSYILDITINSLNEHFKLLETHQRYQFLYGILN